MLAHLVEVEPEGVCGLQLRQRVVAGRHHAPQVTWSTPGSTGPDRPNRANIRARESPDRTKAIRRPAAQSRAAYALLGYSRVNGRKTPVQTGRRDAIVTGAE